MTPFRFGPPHRQLYGIHHRAESGRAPVGAVLLCNPFGQEAIRTHRMFRVLAERLARSGIHAMRFDYFGTGDAAGDDTDGDLDIWRDDVLRAHEELRKRAARRAGHLGSACAWAAPSPRWPPNTRPTRPERLVLWEPIAHGCDYLDALAADHAHALEKSFSLVPKRFRAAPADEAIGFGMGPRLVAQLRALDPAGLAGLKARHATLIPGASAEGRLGLRRGLPPQRLAPNERAGLRARLRLGLGGGHQHGPRAAGGAAAAAVPREPGDPMTPPNELPSSSAATATSSAR